jgi:nucleoside-diphosphate kinase
MSERQDDSLLFVVEWFDPMPQMKRKYLLKYFVDLNSAEMIDLKTKKMFLKKSPCPPHISKDDFYVGGKVLLYSRELDIVDYGDMKTRDRLHFQVQQVVVILPASAYAYWGKLAEEFSHELNMVQAKTVQLGSNSADRICSIVEESPRKSSELSNGVALALLLHAEGGFDKVNNITEKMAQTGLIIFSSKNGQQSSDIGSIVFEQNSGTTATLDNCTCCIIKPHAVKAKQAGAILDIIISQGYEISALRTVQFDKLQAEEFLEVYKSVAPEYPDHVLQLCSGLSIALEIRAQQAVETFRITAGPWDVDMARELRPDTIRGKYGVDRILNAVHCTDLPDDAELECEYVFKLL